MHVIKRPAIPGISFTGYQNEDGTPHFTYYAKEPLLSFVWDGASAHIQVCPGGYGEPVQYLIDAPTNLPGTARDLLENFQDTCDQFLLTDWQNL